MKNTPRHLPFANLLPSRTRRAFRGKRLTGRLMRDGEPPTTPNICRPSADARISSSGGAAKMPCGNFVNPFMCDSNEMTRHLAINSLYSKQQELHYSYRGNCSLYISRTDRDKYTHK
ncbi:hypothetical protein AVEN_246866-1 [Araneus ventricosus]|uniref:Uncharacterized protein n=1 Tax=Araneus ventricosus TaxID=182803 RepID=A0A4Y2L070_ARAVE|nr:hypothetical protein AVEN_246866-1 [Araneus ventricosus]